MGKWINIDDLPSGRVEWDDIFDAPSIDIVRCKECKFNGVWCDIQDIQWRGYDKPVEWCSYGERKEGE